MKTLTATLLRSFATATCALIVLNGCAKKSGTDTTSNLTLSGTLTGASSIVSDLELQPSFMRGIARRVVSFAGRTIVCATLEVPPTVVTGTVAADNTYSLALEKNTPYRCSILNGSTVVATFVFSDSSSKSMSGGSQTIDTVALTGSASVNLTVNTSAGTATGDAGDVSFSTSGTTAFDFTGSYVINALGATLPSGYSALCSGGGGGGGCQGPSAGEQVYLKRFVGKAFTPDAQCTADLTAANNAQTGFTSACNGTTGTEDLYGVAVWSSEAAYNACGNRLGFSYAEAKARANVDLTGSGLGEGAPTWATSVSLNGGGTANITDGWIADTATSDWDIQNCVPTTVGGQKAYKCSELNGTDYQINIGGGCVNSSNEPVQPDWQNVTWGGCTSTSLTGDFAGFQRNVCTATQGANTYTCTNTWGVFDSSNNITNFNNFDWNDTKLVNRGALCSTISAVNNPLQRAQCFANYYQRNLERDGGGSSCLPKVRFNWNTTDATKFLMKEGPLKASKQHVMAGGRYMAGDTFTFRDEENDYRGVQVTDSNGGNSFVNCRVKNVFTMSMKKLNSTEYVVVFVSEGSLLDTENNACAAAAEDSLGLGKYRTIFKMSPAS